MKFLQMPDEESGAAADTGSAAHAAIAAFHRGKGVAESLEIMRVKSSDYPQADLEDAAGLFLSYATDARNVNAKILLIEAPIGFSIAPAPEDPTQAPISVIGTVDQVREEQDGNLYVNDVKSSKKDGTDLLHAHTFQVAAYCIGAAIKLNRPVRSAKLILLRKYAGKNASTAPVFWSYPWTFQDIPQILESVRRRVAEVRAGKLYHVPNKDCCWCHARSPDLCLPKLQEFLSVR